MIENLIKQGMSERQACILSGMNRCSFRYESHGKPEDQTRQEVRELANKHKCYGSPRIIALIRQNRIVNPKKIVRIYREENLQLPRRKPRKRLLRIFYQRPCHARNVNDVWSLDFVFDRTVTQQTLKYLTVVDEYSKVSPTIKVGTKFVSEDVCNALEEAIRIYGKPKYLRSDNGPEFISKTLRGWLLARGIQPVHITPGHPWENGFIESFNGKFRQECLNAELFWGVQEAQMLAQQWRNEYNNFRPHMALGYKTPAEVRRNSVAKPSDN